MGYANFGRGAVMRIAKDSQVVPYILQDYPQWHQGRKAFGVWYIEIEQADVIAYCQQQRAAFAHFLHPQYQRQFHVTLWVCGFVCQQAVLDDDFAMQTLDVQIDVIKQLNLQPFTLNVSRIDSFQSALFLQVQDDSGTLNRIRAALAQTGSEIAPSDYVPHVTLGFYRQSFAAQQIYQTAQQTAFCDVSLAVSKLTFGTYQANQAQGELTAKYVLNF